MSLTLFPKLNKKKRIKMFLSQDKNRKIWYVFFKNEVGKMNKISTRETSKTKANDFLSDFKTNLEERKEARKKMQIVTLEQFKEIYFNYVTSHLQKGTVESIKYTFDRFSSVISYSKSLIDITIFDIEKFKSERLKAGNSKTTINIDLRNLKAMFNKAIKYKFLKENPMNEVEFFEIDEKERMAFNRNELRNLFNVIQNKIHFKIFLFALSTGLRLQEVLNIQYKDIDFQTKYLKICNKADFRTKSGRIRFIPISDSLFKLIDDSKNPNRYVFGKENGYKYEKKHISRTFKEYVREAKLDERFHFHCLRHTFSTFFLNTSGNIYDLKLLLGHSDISTTEIYLHSMPEHTRKAIQSINFNVKGLLNE